MSKSTISTFQLFEMFPTPESARIYLESRLWPDGPFCPECKSRERIGKQPMVADLLDGMEATWGRVLRG